MQSGIKWGQVILRHTERTAYRCFLPDLAGFTGFYCTGPGPDDTKPFPLINNRLVSAISES
jgi:hypothetical protein